jgi:hypothetical protein
MCSCAHAKRHAMGCLAAGGCCRCRAGLGLWRCVSYVCRFAGWCLLASLLLPFMFQGPPVCPGPSLRLHPASPLICLLRFGASLFHPKEESYHSTKVPIQLYRPKPK